MLRQLALGTAALLLSCQLNAQPMLSHVEIHGDNLIEKKTVTVPIVKLTAADKARLRNRATQLLEENKAHAQSKTTNLNDRTVGRSDSRYDRVVDLTMNGLPKLDQGRHGSCATFATTAIIDAAIYESDYISQLCFLSLGMTLAQQDSKTPSGWDGISSGGLEKLKERMEKYGVIDKNDEPNLHCGGFDSYPVNTHRTGHGMSVSDYTAHSHKLPANIELVDIKQDSYKQLIENFKEELENGNRIYLGIFVDPMSYNMGFTDNHNTYYYGDTLVMNNNLLIRLLNEEFDTMGGHAMVIYGYDDKAVVHGQKGVFMLRNSWGESFGYYGDAYVTYDYLKLMLIEAKAIRVKKG